MFHRREWLMHILPNQERSVPPSNFSRYQVSIFLSPRYISHRMSSPEHREPHPDPQALTSNPGHNSKSGVDYEPHPSSSITLSPSRQKIVDSICRLYSGSASEEDMQVYAEKAIYDDPWSYCDTRYKMAGQWYGESTFLTRS